MTDPKTLSLSAWAFAFPQIFILAGTLFHLLFIIQQERKEGLETNRTNFDLAMIVVISILLGALAQVIVFGYYDFKSLEAKRSVALAMGCVASSLGFDGTVWIINKLKDYADDIKRKLLGEKSSTTKGK